MDDKKKIKALLEVLAFYDDVLDSVWEAINEDDKEEARSWCEYGIMEGSFTLSNYKKELGGFDDNDD